MYLFYWNNVYDYKWNKAFFYQHKGNLGLYNLFSIMNTDIFTALTINNKYIFRRRLALQPGASCIPFVGLDGYA